MGYIFFYCQCSSFEIYCSFKDLNFDLKLNTMYGYRIRFRKGYLKDYQVLFRGLWILKSSRGVYNHIGNVGNVKYIMSIINNYTSVNTWEVLENNVRHIV